MSKVHLLRPDEIQNQLRRTWCGAKVEDVNDTTLDYEHCTCQKCLMYATREWGKVPTKKGRK